MNYGAKVTEEDEDTPSTYAVATPLKSRHTASETKDMKQHLQTTFLGLAISLILTAFVVNAETAKTTTSQVNYGYYYLLDYLKEYYRFLPAPAPEGLHYHVRMTAVANIDDTPRKESIVLIVVDTKPRTFRSSGVLSDNCVQAFLLIANTKGSKIEKKAFFKLFDTGTHPLEVPAAEVIELHSPPADFKQPTDVSLRLADVTDDGTLDVWVKSAHGVALISFENGEFKEVFSRYPVLREKLTKTADVEYYSYDVRHEPEGEKYHRFLATPPPEGTSYGTRWKAVANIDDTPEKETIVLMVVNSKEEWRAWSQAFLLITEPETERDGFPKTKAFFKLFGATTHDLKVPTKTIEVQSAPFVFRKPWWSSEDWSFPHVSFDLVDLTGDGILDIWAEHYEGVAVISFQEGEFAEVCSAYSSTRREDPIEYIDLDNDGIYEIKIPDKISVSGIPGAAYPEWVSLYEWDGTTYVLNNERFYANNDEFLTRSLNNYNDWPQGFGKCEEQRFYIGLIYYYRGDAARAREFLQWVVEHGKKQDYRTAAETILKKLPHQ